MSSFVVHKKISKLVRPHYIREGLLRGLSVAEIAASCGVSVRTIQRDIKEIHQDDGFQSWLWQKWIRLYGKVEREQPWRALSAITSIICRTMPSEVRARVEDGLSFWSKPVDMREAIREYGTVITEVLGKDKQVNPRAPKLLTEPRTAGAGAVSVAEPDLPLPPVKACPRCGGEPKFNEGLKEWLCFGCGSPLRLLAPPKRRG